MRTIIATISYFIVSQSMLAIAGVDLDVNIRVPSPQPFVVVEPPPQQTYVPTVTRQPPVIVYESQPRFIFSPILGVYISVGGPYDIVYIGNSYYFYSGGFWYVGPTYRGPWVVAQKRALPKVLKRYRYEQIRSYRDAEYRVYLRNPSHYRGKMYEPVWQTHENHREELREPRREELHRGEFREPRWEEPREPHRGYERREERH